jgi:hypothetical protein
MFLISLYLVVSAVVMYCNLQIIAWYVLFLLDKILNVLIIKILAFVTEPKTIIFIIKNKTNNVHVT